MNQFEQELIRAIEHGCPECGEKSVALKCQEERWYSITVGHKQSKYLDYYPEGDFAIDSQDIAILCGDYDCYTQLWSEVEGWIPELQEIVKGE